MKINSFRHGPAAIPMNKTALKNFLKQMKTKLFSIKSNAPEPADLAVISLLPPPPVGTFNFDFRTKPAHWDKRTRFDDGHKPCDKSLEAAVLAERKRMARGIHDTIGQSFAGLMLQLGAAEEALSHNRTAEAVSCINRACELAEGALRDARRSVEGLRSQTLEKKNLCEALQESIGKMAQGTTLHTEFISAGEPPELPPEWQEHLLRIGLEALTNTIRHARASEFKMKLVFDQQEIRLGLRDNGRGFDPAGHKGFGLRGMRERVETMGGHFFVQSAKGAGTWISITIPLTGIFQSAK